MLTFEGIIRSSNNWPKVSELHVPPFKICMSMGSLWEDSDISATTNPICIYSCWSFHSSQTSENIGYKVFETTNLKTLDWWWCCTWIRARYFAGLKKLLKLHVHLLNYCINFVWAVLLQQKNGDSELGCHLRPFTQRSKSFFSQLIKKRSFGC